MNKSLVRSENLHKRLIYDKNILKEYSVMICEKFYQLFSNYKSFLLYSPIKNEVDVSLLTIKLYKDNKDIFLPIVHGNNLIYGKFEGFDNLKECKFGILEPKQSCKSTPIDVIAIPGVSFDYELSRIGYGKGFYDRFLPKYKQSIKVGLGYDFQLVEYTYNEEKDEKMDIIITEEQVLGRI